MNCVIDDNESANTCTSSCGSVPGVGNPSPAFGGTACPEYTCQVGDGGCGGITF